MDDFVLRPARGGDAAAATAVAFAAKRHWGYSAAQIERWRDGLTLDGTLLECGTAVVACERARPNSIVGVAACAGLDAAGVATLDHLWVVPRAMGQGLGRRLLTALADSLAARGATLLSIESDPHAEGFYRALGARRVGAVAAPIEGEPARLLPLLELSLVGFRVDRDGRPK